MRRRLKRGPLPAATWPPTAPAGLRGFGFGFGFAIAALLLVSFGLRIWGYRNGLPYAYNADENAHFVPRAIGLFGHGWDPHYHVNPPAYTYLLHIVFAVWFGGREGVSHAFATDPGSVFAVARVVSALLGTAAVGLLYLAGARLFDRRVAFLAAALLGVGFLPVFYSHLALNDAPALAPVALALWAAAGVLRFGRRRDYAIAGLGIGLAVATKYTAGIVALPLLAAIVAQYAAPRGRNAAVRGALIAGIIAVAAFVIADPYAVLNVSAFHDGLAHQTTAAGDELGKLGLTQSNGLVYYLWTFGWGMGWVALIAAAVGALLLLRDEPRLSLVLAPAPILFILYMGSQERFFGRWLLPVFPLVCLLAAYGALELARMATARLPALRPLAIGVAVAALCGQGIYYAVHSDRVLARDDTRALTRAWMVDHIPVGARIVAEPVSPDGWAQDVGSPSDTDNGNRWNKFPTSSARNLIARSVVGGSQRTLNFEDYERTLVPELIPEYERQGYCWVVVGSTQRGRAEAEPGKVPEAIAYYRLLERRSRVVFHASPYDPGAGPVAFNFDWSFDYYPRAYHRPGPEMTVYRLRGGKCAVVS